MDEWKTFSAMITLATLPIYWGSIQSTKQSTMESMSMRDTYVFPLTASGVLFGLYLAIKYMSPDLINLLFTVYATAVGMGALTESLSPLLSRLFPFLSSERRKVFRISIPFTSIHQDVFLSSVDFLGLPLSLVLCMWYAFTRNWIGNNILALSFSIVGVETISLGSVAIGSLLLWGLFFYDIFWVFFTPVMVHVAKNLDIPIKFLIPRSSSEGFSMLGVGDVVIPGIFIAMMMRWDRRRAESSKRSGASHIYFWTTLVSYVLGMITTVVVMAVFHRAQPALLYLVPFCTLSASGLAVVRREWEFFEYSEEAPQEEKKKE